MANDVIFTVTVANCVEEECANGICYGKLGTNDFSNSLDLNGSSVENGLVKSDSFNLEEVGEPEDFIDCHSASPSVKSHIERENNSSLEQSLHLNTPLSEFFDAWEELSPETRPQLSPYNVEAELSKIRSRSLVEIEKQKQAEETLENMLSKWLRIRLQLSFVGITLPAEPVAAAKDEQVIVDPAEELCHEIVLARFVSNSIGRGSAKAEIEMEMEAQVEEKNFEIARLYDRLHYYEAVNREMSLRNQEARLPIVLGKQGKEGRGGFGVWFQLQSHLALVP